MIRNRYPLTYLITGHTGFKGAWYLRLLAERGLSVAGFSLDPIPGSLFDRFHGAKYLEKDFRGDITNLESLSLCFERVRPQVVIHLAAQSLVLPSYEEPLGTFRVNALGTANLLECVRRSESVETCLIVTTDKVYGNDKNSLAEGFVETDALGAHDPYSTAKAMSDLWAQCIAKLDDRKKIFIARAGNVIGFGDVSPYRLMPDLVRAWSNGEIAKIRNAKAVRPWQHVSDCLAGYQLLIENSKQLESGTSWNFSPLPEEHLCVEEVVKTAANYWGRGVKWLEENIDAGLETPLLFLDSTKARRELNWTQKYSVDDAIHDAVLGDWSS